MISNASIALIQINAKRISLSLIVRKRVQRYRPFQAWEVRSILVLSIYLNIVRSLSHYGCEEVSEDGLDLMESPHFAHIMDKHVQSHMIQLIQTGITRTTSFESKLSFSHLSCPID
jgi:hypothetical protein